MKCERESAVWSGCNNTHEFGPIKVLALPCVLESERLSGFPMDPNLSILTFFVHLLTPNFETPKCLAPFDP
jgi:hypothetical protein